MRGAAEPASEQRGGEVASAMRKAIARQMTLSKQTIPHYYLTMRADVSNALQKREAYNTACDSAKRISINDLIIKAAALALARHPAFNGFYQAETYTPATRTNIGVAIAVPDGLIAPAILDCQALSLAEIAARAKDLVARARAGKLRAEEYSEATFTVSNLGMFGVDTFTAIVVPPQVAILAAGAVCDVLVLREGTVATIQQVGLTLSADHRATDGAQGALFLADVVAALQEPEMLFAA
jgi:pyruvate dehydrogenase E2 component (dihydrolipoamide acetyltransferase)